MQKKTASNGVLLSMAVAGLFAGCTSKEEPKAPAASSSKPNVNAATMGLPEHACKAYNDCKGKGGCTSGDNGCAGKNSCKGKGGCATVAKHGCAGQNSCKGLGGCSGGDNGCKTKNSCKGKGGCSVPISMH